MKKLPLIAAAIGASCLSVFCLSALTPATKSSASKASHSTVAADTVPPTIMRLTDDDYREVAEELGVEVAAIKAVVDIEAGATHQGFHAPGMPLVNFDLTMFKRFAGKRGLNLSKYYRSHPAVFNRRGRLTQSVQHERLRAARTIDNTTAVEGTFWGMFQIGGFNWKKCGAESIDDFVERMSRSEREQLELFGQFITNTGLLTHLKNKNWAAFARGYNGASYAKRGYHTRLASAYARHLKDEKSAETNTKVNKNEK